MGNKLFARVRCLVHTEQLVARITGMLMELPSTEVSALLVNEDAFRHRVDEARALITMSESIDRNQTRFGLNIFFYFM